METDISFYTSNCSETTHPHIVIPETHSCRIGSWSNLTLFFDFYPITWIFRANYSTILYLCVLASVNKTLESDFVLCHRVNIYGILFIDGGCKSCFLAFSEFWIPLENAKVLRPWGLLISSLQDSPAYLFCSPQERISGNIPHSSPIHFTFLLFSHVTRLCWSPFSVKLNDSYAILAFCTILIVTVLQLASIVSDSCEKRKSLLRRYICQISQGAWYTLHGW